MKTQLITLLALVAFHSAASRGVKSKRGSFEGWQGIPLQNSGGNAYPPIHVIGEDISLQAEIPAPAPGVVGVVSNAIDKPVMESQEYIPPQSLGSVILPQMRQPATPVNAAGSNVPANQGAVFLGSGSLGVVNLGGGAYALGSGSIGYSGNRAQPRPNAMVPVYPPLPANPNLIPAAVPSPAPLPPIGQIPNSIDYNNPFAPQGPVYDQNGYEYLRPDRVGFGMALPPRPPRVRNQFATPSALQLQPQVPQPLPPLNYDFISLGHPTAAGLG